MQRLLTRETRRPLRGEPVRQKRLLNYAAATDLYNGGTFTGGGWRDVISDQSFTVEEAGSIISVALHSSMFGTVATAGTRVARAVLIDGTTRYLVGGSFTPYTGAYMQFFGPGVVKISGLTPGTHTIRFQLYADFNITAAYLRAATVPSQEFLRIQVVEEKQRRGFFGTLKAHKILSSYTAGSLANATSPASGAWVDLNADQNFSVEGNGNSVIEFSIQLHAFMQNSTNNYQTEVALLIDGTTRYKFGNHTATQVSAYYRMSGCATWLLNGLAKGVHTWRVQFWVTAGTSTLYMRGDGVEHLNAQITERQNPQLNSYDSTDKIQLDYTAGNISVGSLTANVISTRIAAQNFVVGGGTSSVIEVVFAMGGWASIPSLAQSVTMYLVLDGVNYPVCMSITGVAATFWPALESVTMYFTGLTAGIHTVGLAVSSTETGTSFNCDGSSVNQFARIRVAEKH